MTMPTVLPRQTTWLSAGLVMILSLLLAVGCNEVSEEEAHQREMVAAGRASYRAYCAGCHGLEAKGNGPAAPAMKIPPADLTTISQRHGGTFPEEWVFDKIDGRNLADTSGTLQMLHFGDVWRGTTPTPERRREVRQMIDEIVAYLESVQE